MADADRPRGKAGGSAGGRGGGAAPGKGGVDGPARPLPALPDNMKTPGSVQIRWSGIDSSNLGVWALELIPAGTRFAPFQGEKVITMRKDSDPLCVWEIVDLETNEFLFYVDATRSDQACWMKHVQRAHHLEEQNVLADQDGIDIVYTIIKPVLKGDELLTWYKLPSTRRGQRQAGRESRGKAKSIKDMPSKPPPHTSPKKMPVKIIRMPASKDASPARDSNRLKQEEKEKQKEEERAKKEKEKKDKDKKEKDKKEKDKKEKEMKDKKEMEMKEKKEKELKEKKEKEKEMKEKKDKDLKEKKEKEKKEKEMKEKKEKEIKDKKEKEMKEKKEKELKERKEKELKERKEKELKERKEKKEKELKEKKEKDMKEKKEKELKERKDKEMKEKKEKEIKEKEKEMKEKKEREMKEKKEKEIKERKEKEMKDRKEKEMKERKEKEMKERKDKEMKEKKEKEIKEKEKEMKEKKEKEMKEKEKEMKERKDKEMKEKREKEIKEKEKEMKEKKEKDLKEKKEKDMREKEIKDKKENELKQKEMREQEMKEKKIKEKEKELEKKEREEKEIRATQLREKALRENELRQKELREKEIREQKELKEREMEVKENALREKILKEKDLKMKEKRDKELKEKREQARKQKETEKKEKELREKENEKKEKEFKERLLTDRAQKEKQIAAAHLATALELDRDSSDLEIDLDDDEDDDGDDDEDSDIADVTNIKVDGNKFTQSEDPEKFHFKLNKNHITKSRHGRKVFKCDICSGIYRHAFSLKRHYIRNHINLKYVSRGDILNCQINPDTHDLGATEDKDNVGQGQGQMERQTQSPIKGHLEEIRKGAVKVENKIDSNGRSLSSSPMPKGCDISPTIDALSQRIKQEHAGKASWRPDGSSASLVMDLPRDMKPEDDLKVERVDPDQEEVIEPLSGLYRCNVCCSYFDTVALLKSHIENHPNLPSSKAFACDQCDMKFSHKQNLRRHLAVHTGEKPFLCKFCSKTFPTATNQKRHERIHLGRRVACDYCRSTFTQSGDLKKHIRKLHPESFHECAFCGKYFTDEVELIEHVSSHNESLQSNEAERHRRRQAFKVDMELDRVESMRLAEQKTPGIKFACTVCKKRFLDYANMCRHRRLAHQRHLLIGSHGSNSSSPVPSPTKLASDSSDCDPHAFFYANIANNISENLTNYMEGTKEHLEKTANQMKLKNKAIMKESPEKTQEAKPQVEADIVTYNFPAGFCLEQNYRKVISDKDKITFDRGKKSKASAKFNDLKDFEKHPELRFKETDLSTTSKCLVVSEVRTAKVIEPKGSKVNKEECEMKPAISTANGVSLNIPVFNLSNITKRDIKTQPVCTVQPIQRQVHTICEQSPEEIPVPVQVKKTVSASNDIHSVAVDIDKPAHMSLVNKLSMSSVNGSAPTPPPQSPRPSPPPLQQVSAVKIVTKAAKSTSGKSTGASSRTPPGPASCLALKIPQVHICSVCRRLFNNEHLLRQHMMDKHKTTHGETHSPSPQKEKEPKEKTVGEKVDISNPVMDLSGKKSPIVNKPVEKAVDKEKAIIEHDEGARLLLDFALGIRDEPDTYTRPAVESPKVADVLEPFPLDLSGNISTLSSPPAKSDSSEKANKPQDSSTKPKLPVCAAITAVTKTGNHAPAAHNNRDKTQGLLRIPTYHPLKDLDLPGPLVSPPGTPRSPWLPSQLPSLLCGPFVKHSGRNGGTRSSSKKFICTVCYGEFPSRGSLHNHQRATHSNVRCDHVEVDTDVVAPWWQKPSPVGMLNVCSSQISEYDQSDQQQFKCTKCSRAFSAVEQLHSHIFECASVGKRLHRPAPTHKANMAPKSATSPAAAAAALAEVEASAAAAAAGLRMLASSSPWPRENLAPSALPPSVLPSSALEPSALEPSAPAPVPAPAPAPPAPSALAPSESESESASAPAPALAPAPAPAPVPVLLKSTSGTATLLQSSACNMRDDRSRSSLSVGSTIISTGTSTGSTYTGTSTTCTTSSTAAIASTGPFGAFNSSKFGMRSCGAVTGTSGKPVCTATSGTISSRGTTSSNGTTSTIGTTSTSGTTSSSTMLERFKSSCLRKKKSREFGRVLLTKRRRRSLELLYNPLNHVRRREMTQVVDMQRCQGCGQRFNTISLLERHIPLCSQKERLKEIQFVRNPFETVMDPTELRNVCRYCNKQFTYLGMLRKHVFTVCQVRKSRMVQSKPLDASWEQELAQQYSGPAPLDICSSDGSHPPDDAVSISNSTCSSHEMDGSGQRSRPRKRKNRGWGNGKKKRYLSGKPQVSSGSAEEAANLEDDDLNEDDLEDDDAEDGNDVQKDDEDKTGMLCSTYAESSQSGDDELQIVEDVPEEKDITEINPAPTPPPPEITATAEPAISSTSSVDNESLSETPVQQSFIGRHTLPFVLSIPQYRERTPLAPKPKSSKIMISTVGTPLTANQSLVPTQTVHIVPGKQHIDLMSDIKNKSTTPTSKPQSTIVVINPKLQVASANACLVKSDIIPKALSLSVPQEVSGVPVVKRKMDDVKRLAVSNYTQIQTIQFDKPDIMAATSSATNNGIATSKMETILVAISAINNDAPAKTHPVVNKDGVANGTHVQCASSAAVCYTANKPAVVIAKTLSGMSSLIQKDVYCDLPTVGGDATRNSNHQQTVHKSLLLTNSADNSQKISQVDQRYKSTLLTDSQSVSSLDKLSNNEKVITNRTEEQTRSEKTKIKSGDTLTKNKDGHIIISESTLQTSVKQSIPTSDSDESSDEENIKEIINTVLAQTRFGNKQKATKSKKQTKQELKTWNAIEKGKLNKADAVRQLPAVSKPANETGDKLDKLAKQSKVKPEQDSLGKPAKAKTKKKTQDNEASKISSASKKERKAKKKLNSQDSQSAELVSKKDNKTKKKNQVHPGESATSEFATKKDDRVKTIELVESDPAKIELLAKVLDSAKTDLLVEESESQKLVVLKAKEDLQPLLFEASEISGEISGTTPLSEGAGSSGNPSKKTKAKRKLIEISTKDPLDDGSPTKKKKLGLSDKKVPRNFAEDLDRPKGKTKKKKLAGQQPDDVALCKKANKVESSVIHYKTKAKFMLRKTEITNDAPHASETQAPVNTFGDVTTVKSSMNPVTNTSVTMKNALNAVRKPTSLVKTATGIVKTMPLTGTGKTMPITGTWKTTPITSAVRITPIADIAKATPITNTAKTMLITGIVKTTPITGTSKSATITGTVKTMPIAVKTVSGTVKSAPVAVKTSVKTGSGVMRTGSTIVRSLTSAVKTATTMIKTTAGSVNVTVISAKKRKRKVPSEGPPQQMSSGSKDTNGKVTVASGTKMMKTRGVAAAVGVTADSVKKRVAGSKSGAKPRRVSGRGVRSSADPIGDLKAKGRIAGQKPAPPKLKHSISGANKSTGSEERLTAKSRTIILSPSMRTRQSRLSL